MARSIFSLGLLLLVAASPAWTQYQRPNNQDCVAAGAPVASSSVSYFPTQYQLAGERVQSSANTVTVSVAKDFQVQYFPNYKVVTNSLVNETYVLYQCGTPAPNATALPSGAKVFQVPLTSIAVPETVPLAFLVRLGLVDRIQSVSSFATAPCGQALLACGHSAPSTTKITGNATTLAALNNLVDGIVTSSAAKAVPKTFAFSASMDPGPLNRAEWLKFLGLFFNADAAASDMFAQINATYFQHAAPASLPLASRPTLAFISNYSYPPQQALEVSLAAYKVKYTIDAGAQPPNRTVLAATPGVVYAPYDLTNSTFWFTWGSNAKGSFPTQQAAMDAFHQFLEQVDVIVDETYAIDPTSYDYGTFLDSFGLNETDALPALDNLAVFREDGLISPTGGLDWFEGAIARPDQVLPDFRAAVEPDMFPSYNATWIRNIAQGVQPTVVSFTNCAQNTACQAVAPTPICPFVKACDSGATVTRQGTCSYPTCVS